MFVALQNRWLNDWVTIKIFHVLGALFHRVCSSIRFHVRHWMFEDDCLLSVSWTFKEKMDCVYTHILFACIYSIYVYIRLYTLYVYCVYIIVKKHTSGHCINYINIENYTNIGERTRSLELTIWNLPNLTQKTVIVPLLFRFHFCCFPLPISVSSWSSRTHLA